MGRVAALIVLGWVCAGCQPDTCEDIECLMNHLELTTSDGQQLTLTEVPSSSVPLASSYTPPEGSSSDGFDLMIVPLSAPNFGDPLQMIAAGLPAHAPGAGEEGLMPAITNQPPALDFASTSTERTLELDYDDPNGMRPAFWLSPGDQGRPYPHCVWMSAAERDGLTHGQVVLRMRVNAVVDFSAEKFWTNPCGQLIGEPPQPPPQGARGPIVGPAVSTRTKPPLAGKGGGAGGGGGGGGAVGDEIWMITRPDGARARVAIHGGAFASDGAPQWTMSNNAGDCSFDVVISGQMSGTAFDFTTHGSGCDGYSVQGTAMGTANGSFGTANQATASYSETYMTPGGSLTNTGMVHAERVQ